MKLARTHRWQRILATLLLLAYGSAGVLGYGLHSLWHYQHHVGVHVGCHDHACHHHSDHAADPVISLVDDCSICAFLAQAQAEHGDEVPVLCTTFRPAEPPASDSLDLPAPSRLHLARGPPLL